MGRKDDAFHLKGRALRLTEHTAVRFLDEGIDISQSEDVIIRGNCLASGRIGVAATAGRLVYEGAHVATVRYIPEAPDASIIFE